MIARFLSEASSVRKMSDFRAYLKQLKEKNKNKNFSIGIARLFVNSSTNILHKFKGMDLPWCAVGDIIAWSVVEIKPGIPPHYVVKVVVAMDNGDELVEGFHANVGKDVMATVGDWETDIKKEIKRVSDAIKKISRIQWSEKHPLVCFDKAVNCFKALDVWDTYYITDSFHSELKESLVQSVSKMEDFLDKNYPEEWKRTSMRSTIKSGFNDTFSYIYPDGSPGEWFTAGDSILVISGIRRYTEKFMTGAIYTFKIQEVKGKKEFFSGKTYYFSIDNESGSTKESMKRMTAGLKNIMKRAARLSGWDSVHDFLKKEEDKDFMKMIEVK